MRISIHAPREGGDAVGGLAVDKVCNFNPRPPRGGRLDCIHSTPETITISIHAPREGGDHTAIRSHKIQDISIHAPREGGDV